MRRAVILAILSIAVAAQPAAAAWRQPAGGPSPINHSDRQPAFNPGLVVREGTPWVAWSEWDGANYEVRVARLNRDTDTWDEVPDVRTPINHNPNRDGTDPSLALVGDALYVAWAEYDGAHWQLRVSKLDDATSTWSEVRAPLNHAPEGDAHDPSLAAVGGMPFVGWSEWDGAHYQARVASLTAGGWQEVVPGASPINHTPDRDASWVSLASEGDEAYVAWQEWNGHNNELWVSEWKPGHDAWEPVGGTRSVNRDATRSATRPSLLAIGGVWHIAWTESDGQNFELRVARLNAASNRWDELAGGESPINQSPSADAFRPSLAGIGGRPYVAWTEAIGTYDGPEAQTSYAVHVARLNTSGSDWQHVVRGDAPIAESAGGIGSEPSLRDIGGVPYVAWREFDGRNSEIRVGRLEPELLDATEAASGQGELLQQRVRTYGVPYPIGVSVDDDEPVVRTTAADAYEDVVSVQVGDLLPGTVYSWRAFGWDGVEAIAAGEPRPFETPADATSDFTPDFGDDFSDDFIDDEVSDEVEKLVLVPTRATFRGRARHKVRMRYVLDRRATVTVSVFRGTRRVARLRRKGRAGRNTVTWKGRAGRYLVRFVARDSDGVTARAKAKLVLRR